MGLWSHLNFQINFTTPFKGCRLTLSHFRKFRGWAPETVASEYNTSFKKPNTQFDHLFIFFSLSYFLSPCCFADAENHYSSKVSALQYISSLSISKEDKKVGNNWPPVEKCQEFWRASIIKSSHRREGKK